MKYILLTILGLASCACTDMTPNRLSLTPSYEMEIEQGQNIKHKPKVETSLDWKL